MKVVVIGRVFSDSFARCILDALGDLGHPASALDPDPLFPKRVLSLAGSPLRAIAAFATTHPALERRQNAMLVRRLVHMRPELVIATGRGLDPSSVSQLKQALGIPVVFVFSDHLGNMERQYPFAAAYDALFYKDPYIVDTVSKKLGLQAYYLPESCHPKWHHRVDLTAAEQHLYGCDITTAGNMYNYRARILERFVGYDMKIWGGQFPTWIDSPLRAYYPNVYVAELEKAKAFNAAKVVINTMHYAEIWGVNLRTFEVAGCGGFQIADARPWLDQLFDTDREIITYETADELKDKVDYYLGRPDQRQAIANAGYRRAHREHTYAHRLQRVIRVVDGVRRGRVDEPALELPKDIAV